MLTARYYLYAFASISAATFLSGAIAGGCSDAKTCYECFQASSLCRWCAGEKSCHNIAAATNVCEMPIARSEQCWGEACPRTIGDLGSRKIVWGLEAVAHATDPLAKFKVYGENSTGVFRLETGQEILGQYSAKKETSSGKVVTIGLAADWASGTCESKVVGELMRRKNFDYTIHLGDTYYSGTLEQTKQNFFGKVPPGKNRTGVSFPNGKIGTFALPGNHEMISGGTAYYDHTLERIGMRSIPGDASSPMEGQGASYFGLENEFWRVIGLDSGYLCYVTNEEGHRIIDLASLNLAETNAPQPDEVIDWLKNQVKLGDPNDKRGIVLLTHHHPHSIFGFDSPSPYNGTSSQLSSIFEGSKRKILWFFGHEHALALHKTMRFGNFEYMGRMVGNGGYSDPQLAHAADPATAIAFDNRTYQLVDGDLPVGKASSIGFNGYASLAFEGENLTVSYFTGACKQEDCKTGYSPAPAETPMARERFTAGGNGNVSGEITFLSPLLHIVHDEWL